MNFILCSPDSSFWETDFSSFLVLYASLLWQPVVVIVLLSTVLSTGAGKLHLAPQLCICCDHAQRQCHCGWSEVVWAAWPTRENRGDCVSEASVLCWRCLVGMYFISCADGNKLVLFPRWGGWEGQRTSCSSLSLWVPRGREEWGKPSCCSRYCKVCEDCCSVAIQARESFLKAFFFFPLFSFFPLVWLWKGHV